MLASIIDELSAKRASELHDGTAKLKRLLVSAGCEAAQRRKFVSAELVFM